MGRNLRLSPETEEALRAESERSGKSQQEIMREGIDQRVGLVPAPASRDVDPYVLDGTLLPPRTPYRRVKPRLRLPEGETMQDTLDWVRSDRF